MAFLSVLSEIVLNNKQRNMKLKSILSALLLMPGTVAGQESAPLAGRANLLIY